MGLPRCAFYARFGMRCPSCGMTTAWACVVRGKIAAALRANAAGAVLAMVDAAGVAWLAVCGIRGRWWPLRPNPTWIVWLITMVFAGALGDWAIRLAGRLVCSSGNP